MLQIKTAVPSLLMLLATAAGAQEATPETAASVTETAAISGDNEAAADTDHERPADQTVAQTVPVAGEAPPPPPPPLPLPPSALPARLGIEEVLVTAQRRSENVNDVPIAISAFSGDDLKALGVKDARDLANLVPGFTAADNGGNTPIYTLRGVGFNDTTYTATSTVGVYVDEVSLPYSVMTKGSSLDLERLEVLKGPQGILYGRNTTGGAINYIARKPTDHFEAGISVSYGRFLTRETEAYISGPLLGDINGRLAVKDIHAQDGWQYSNTRPGDTLGKKNKQAFRASLEWQALDNLKFRLVSDGWWDRSDAQARQAIGIREQNGVDPTGQLFLPPQTRAYPVIAQDADPRVADWPTTYPWQLNDHFLSASLRSDWQISDRVSFTGIASQMRVDSDNSQIPSAGFNFNAFEQILNAHIETSALELRLGGTQGNDDRIKWLVGGNISKDRGFEQHDQLADFQSALFPDPVTGRSTVTNRPAIYGNSDVTQYAGFANADWQFVEDWTLTLGGRYTQQAQDYTGCSYVSPQASYDLLSNVFTGISAANAAQYTLTTGRPGHPSIVTTGHCFTVAADGSTDPFRSTLDEHNISLRSALDWKATADSLYYLSLARGYKAGGYPVLSASTQAQLKPVTQEQVLASEIGAKITALQKQLHINLASYFYDYNNKQLLTKARDPIFGPLPVLQNAPKSQVYGAELDLQYAPNWLPGLYLALSGAYTHTEIREFVGLDSAGNTYDFAGRPFNFSPKYQGTVLANYTHALFDDIDWLIGGDYRYSGTTSSSLDADPVFRHQAYSVIGARLGVQGSAWSLTAYGRNLSNTLVPITVLAYGDSINRYVGEPLVYGLSFDYRW